MVLEHGCHGDFFGDGETRTRARRSAHFLLIHCFTLVLCFYSRQNLNFPPNKLEFHPKTLPKIKTTPTKTTPPFTPLPPLSPSPPLGHPLSSTYLSTIG